MAPRAPSSAGGRPWLGIGAALAVPLLPFALIGELPGDRWLSARGADAWIFGLSGVGILASDLLLPVPSSVVGSLLAARLGAAPGFVCIWLGLSLGHGLGYALGRWLPARWAAPLPEAPSVALLFLSRPVPVLAEATALAAGAARLAWVRCAAAIALGNALYAAGLAWSGAAWLPGWPLGLGLAVPLAVPALGWLLWRVRAPAARPMRKEPAGR